MLPPASSGNAPWEIAKGACMSAPTPRLSIVTLGVRDMARARAFYEALGWVASSASNDNVTFFHSKTALLSLYGRAALAEDATLEDTPVGFSGVTLAWNCASDSETDAAFAAALAAGAKAVKAPHKVFWGGYSGYFADPDGHLWEVAHNPFAPFDSEGRLTMPETES
jgi:uncharacterized protein